MSIKIRKLVPEDFPAVAIFLAEMNSQKQHNFSDLGVNAADIEYFIKDDLLDMPATEGFHLAFDDEKLIGVWGLDFDNGKGYLYSLGPYIKQENWQDIAEKLWHEVKKTIPSNTECLIMSLNSENTNGIEFAVAHGFKCEAVGITLKLKQSEFIPCEHSHIIELVEEHHEAFCELHDSLFPGTYYSGKDIIGRCDGVRKVFVNDPVTGYIYVEPRPEFGAANLEFIGVHPDSRGGGLGQALLSRGIDYVFSFDKITDISLAVREGNPAIRLYERLGFKTDDIVHSYELEFKS